MYMTSNAVARCYDCMHVAMGVEKAGIKRAGGQRLEGALWDGMLSKNYKNCSLRR